MLTLHAAYEHGRGLRAVLGADEPLPIPAMSLARSIYEGVVQVCWLLDAEVSTEHRLVRWAGRLLHDSQETPAVLSQIPSGVVQSEQAADAAEGRELGKQLMDRAGFVLKEKGGVRAYETANVAFRGEKTNLVPNIESFLARFMPGDEHLWPLLSGATHCRGWFVAGLEGDEALLVASVLTPLLSTSDALVVEVGRYLGLPIRPQLERTHLQRQALLGRARPASGPTVGIDLYRASIGAWALPK